MDKSYTISEVASKLGIATKTLRRWEEAGRFQSSRTLGNQRRYNMEDLQILDAIKHNIISKQSDLLTLPAAASLCSVSPSSIERWVKEGRIHPFITSGKTFYPRERLIAKLDELSRGDTMLSPTLPPPEPLPTKPTAPPLPSPIHSLEAPKLTALPTASTESTVKLRHFISRLSPLLNTFVTIILILIYHFLVRPPSTEPISPSLSTPPPTKNQEPATNNYSPPLYLTLSPITPPDPIPGTLYFDAGSQSLRLFTDTWTDLALPINPDTPITLSPSNTDLISGTRVLRKGTSNILINHKSITPSTPITITFTSDYSPGKKYWLEQSQGSFTLHTDFPVAQNSSFTYLILTPSLNEPDIASSTPTVF